MPRLRVRDMGTALKFDGSASRVQVTGVASLQLTSAVSVAAWIKPASIAANQAVISKTLNNSGYSLINRSTGIKLEIGNGTSTQSSPARKYAIGELLHVVGTFNGTAISLYVNGALVGTTSISSTTITDSGTDLQVGRGAGGAFDFFSGIIDEAQVYNTVLSLTDVQNLYYSGTVATGCAMNLKFDEGAGSTALDSSGNGNNGTITSATYTSDVVMKPRKLVNDNLVMNPSFEYAPPFTAVQTGVNWINGTAAGSGSSNLFSWYVGAVPANGSVRIDPTTGQSGSNSIKLDKTAGGASSINVLNVASTNLASSSILEQSTNMIRVYPNTSYTLSFYYKQRSKAGGTVQVYRDEFTGASTTRISFTSIYSDSSTTDLGWTLVTNTFTTSATTNYLALEFQWVNATTGTVWFDDITLKPTIPLEVR